MRPVDRGSVPLDPTGVPKAYSAYADARQDLNERLGRYCSFCERSIVAGLAVEHVLPKVNFPHLTLVWGNFLLACMNCNTTKGTKVPGQNAFLPDQDNTFRALAYATGGTIRPAQGLQKSQKSKATRLIRLVGLDRMPGADPKARDLRWNDRRESWDKAVRYRDKYEAGTIVLHTLVDLVRSDGHWSIWMTVFSQHLAVRLAFIHAIPGVPPDCFDEFGHPLLRRGGRI